MGKRMRLVFWLLTAIFCGYDFYLWGGLARTPLVGQRLRDEAIFVSPIAATYLFLGRHVVDTLQRGDESAAFAARRFPTLIPNNEAEGPPSVGRFLAAQSATGTLAYYAAPVLLLLSLVLHAMRQKQIRSFGGKG